MSKRRNIGSVPGTIVYTGEKTTTPVKVNYIEYNNETHRSFDAFQRGELHIHPPVEKFVQWYDIRGLHNNKVIQSIADAYKIHPLALEDAVDVYQRPTYIEYQDGHFISLKALSYQKEKSNVVRESISLYFGDKFVITFQETEGDLFEDIRNRIVYKKGRVSSRGGDYLTYILIDFIVDNYFQVLDQIEEEIETLEEKISLKADDVDKLNIYRLKKEILKIRKSVAPLREAINMFTRSDSKLIDPKTATFIRDVYDHTIHITDNADSMRDILSGLQDLYISEVSLEMNRVMQVLTIVTAIFVPLSFLAGLYGMNFEYIPELTYRNGYFVLLGVMATVAIGMIFYFRSKKWF
ncbi:magnesium/cobalt transporter CorA [Portibacter marinus]|uniref:magnesium/cobalt transporter CorA n=1 Tax=Portibacter marinus TaxID=2898660 RepID=UPI001F385FBE|nr:magnesium/cobalt transporter CorA [Portibacter marinus]